MYHRIARTERYRWWKPLVELMAFTVLVFAMWLTAIPVLYELVGPAENGAPGIIKLALTIAVAMPAAFMAARIMGRRWGALWSVEGRFRVSWFAICLVAAAGQIGLSYGISAVVEALGHTLGPARGAWVGMDAFLPLAITVLLVIPLQASAEEFLFRGTLVQALGAWVRWPWFSIVISGVIFGAAHALPLEGFVAISTFGIVAAWLTIKTGGLEAAIALHVVNNVTVFMFGAATGRADRWITELNVDLRWTSTAIDVSLQLLYALVIAKLYARRGAR